MAMIKKILYIILTIIILGGSLYLATYAGIEHRYELYRSFSLIICWFGAAPNADNASVRPATAVAQSDVHLAPLVVRPNGCVAPGQQQRAAIGVTEAWTMRQVKKAARC